MSIFCSISSYADKPAATNSMKTNGVAKVIILKGSVRAILSENIEVELKKGMWLPEGSIVLTKEKSFAKLLFTDKSSMNVGPSSEMKITKFSKDEAGVIHLLKGEIRSKVTKDYMNIKEKDKSKLIIKTKSAALGVRGTDYIVSFSPVTERTSLNVISGLVAMAPLTDFNLSNNQVDTVLNSNKAVYVSEGFSSQVTKEANNPTPPLEIPKSQLEDLKNNENSIKAFTTVSINITDEKEPKESKQKDQEKKEYRKIPKGAPASVLTNKLDTPIFENATSEAELDRSPASITETQIEPDYLPPLQEDEYLAGESCIDRPELCGGEEANPCDTDPCGNCGICELAPGQVPLEESIISVPEVSPNATVDFNISVQ